MKFLQEMWHLFIGSWPQHQHQQSIPSQYQIFYSSPGGPKHAHNLSAIFTVGCLVRHGHGQGCVNTGPAAGLSGCRARGEKIAGRRCGDNQHGRCDGGSIVFHHTKVFANATNCLLLTSIIIVLNCKCPEPCPGQCSSTCNTSLTTASSLDRY